MRLRKWVKVTLAIIVGVLFMVWFTNWTNTEINNCVNSGKTLNYCEQALK